MIKTAPLSNLRLSSGIDMDLALLPPAQGRGPGANHIGLTGVRAGNLPLRSPSRPMFVEIRTPDGLWAYDYHLEALQPHREGYRLEFALATLPQGPMELQLHAVRGRYRTDDWTRDAQIARNTNLILDVNPVIRRLGRHEARGFSYQYQLVSDHVAVYKLLDRGTWEIGGSALGNELWMRSSFCRPICPITHADQHYSTEWYLPSCVNPNIFQFLTLQTSLQGFTFTAGEQGVLITWASRLGHVRTLLEKPRKSLEIGHFHEHCGDLARDFSSTPMEVLWVPGRFNRVQRANLYEHMRELVSQTLHAELDITPERATTFAMIEEWGNPDFDRYNNLGLPKLLEAGVKTVFLPNELANNMNTFGALNMCATVDYRIPENVGEAKLRQFCARAAEAGCAVQMWGNTAVSTLAYQLHSRHGLPQLSYQPEQNELMNLIARAEDPFVRTPSNAIEADHYAPLFAVLNLRDPAIFEYFLARWQYLREQVGITGIFWDSSNNLSSDKFHYCQNLEDKKCHGATPDQPGLLGFSRPAKEPEMGIFSQYMAHLRLMAAMKKSGIGYCGEDLGVFGTHRTGPAVPARLESLWLWTDCFTDFDPAALEAAGIDSKLLYFKGLAYRLMWTLYWLPTTDELSFRYAKIEQASDRPTPWHLGLLGAYNRVWPWLERREVLPEEAGVVYRSGDRQVVWCFETLTHKLEHAQRITNVLSSESWTADQVEGQGQQVYLVEPL